MPKLQAPPDRRGRFGPYGGRFVPETLIAALEQLDREYSLARQDPQFQAEFAAAGLKVTGTRAVMWGLSRMWYVVGQRE